MRTDILGVGFDDLTLEEAAAAGARLVEEPGFHYAVTPNPEFLLAAKSNPEFRQALLDAHLVLADGVGVAYAAKILGRPLKGRVPGIDFAQRLLSWMAHNGKRLFLLGAKPGTATPGCSSAAPTTGTSRRTARWWRRSAPAALTLCLSAWARPSRSSGWRSTARTPAHT